MSTSFACRAHHPRFWLAQAKQLDRAAMLIWSAIREDYVRMSQFEVGAVVQSEQVPYANLGGVFWLLAGSALENLFKGLLVKGKPHLVIEGRIDRSIKTHDLLKLAKRASFDLTVFDAFYLDVATKCVTWAGRYPSSTKPGETGQAVFSESDVNVYRSLFDRLADRFNASDSRETTFKRLG